MTEYDGLREERRAVAFLPTLPLHFFHLSLPVPLHCILSYLRQAIAFTHAGKGMSLVT